MTLSEIHVRRQMGRKVYRMAAVLLPFTADGDIAEEAYAACSRKPFTPA